MTGPDASEWRSWAPRDHRWSRRTSIGAGACAARRRPAVFVLVLEGIANASEFAKFPHASASVGEVGKIIRLLKDAGCSEVTLAGRVARPEFSSIKLDRIGRQHIGGILAAALKGDDALLRAVISILEKHGLRRCRFRGRYAGPPGPGGSDRENSRRGVQICRTSGKVFVW